ncbi:uncharacterized protein LOC126368970 isoform X2 [Pectinophora gossypiella]|uniref:uncharacterized protein LOC126368970 isoform X2 n=1 Tax=Pectinophora gossypiella TaxID=13191 RepID=UPI00214EA735|nr:uncharacterized protein LOC126368970 isoform X2 [Pectinophora gossypiella]XP_049869197.1 uncharacterized protein LOC126368970 isoform X2 [Pectinophora gossypiella]XP_049869199.1 uncharacterized protein LOC126368970 isoform X2 [Pectinophora gossypiella]
MNILYFLPMILIIEVNGHANTKYEEIIDVIDLSHPTTLSILAEFYGAVEKRWKICMNCGIAGLGTAMHLEHEVSSSNSMYPAVIPTEYLITRLAVIDVSTLVKLNSNLVLSLEVALQWPVLRADPKEPTLLLFKFGWKAHGGKTARTCVCKIPGISFELAEWIAGNLTHVVGVATDTPTLESEQTREFNTKTIANILGKSGVYMIENVNIRRSLPDNIRCIYWLPSRYIAPCAARLLYRGSRKISSCVLQFLHSPI